MASVKQQPLSGATAAGLFCALVVPYLTYLFLRTIYGGVQSPARIEAGLLLHWINLAALILVVMLAERRPLASIGLRKLRWWTIPLAVVAAVIIIVVSSALTQAFRLSADQVYATRLQSLPIVFRVLLAVTAGVFEETLYRGYALERLAALCGSAPAAAALSLTLFVLMHVPAVGWGHLAPVAIVGTLITLLYLWRRDLVTNIVAHIIIDGVGLLLSPMLHH
jgi:membrane protease YdiL (CAAX protease family)